MACPFCGSTDPLTNEHIWSEWIRKRFSPPGKVPYHHTWTDSKGNRQEREFKTKPFREKTKCACEKCNNQWMSRLDTAAMPYGIPILEGRRRTLHETGQLTLAKWAILKALAAEYLQRNPASRIIPARHYREMYELRDTLEVPAGIEVWVARYSGPNLGRAERFRGDISGTVTYHEGGDPVPVDAKVYLATYIVGELAFQVFGHDTDLPFGRTWGTVFTPRVHRLCPFDDSFIWPPGPPLTDDLMPVFLRPPGRSA